MLGTLCAAHSCLHLNPEQLVVRAGGSHEHAGHTLVAFGRCSEQQWLRAPLPAVDSHPCAVDSHLCAVTITPG